MGLRVSVTWDKDYHDTPYFLDSLWISSTATAI